MSQPVCRFWQAGKFCHFGTSCKYKHSEEGLSFPGAAQIMQPLEQQHTQEDSRVRAAPDVTGKSKTKRPKSHKRTQESTQQASEGCLEKVAAPPAKRHRARESRETGHTAPRVPTPEGHQRVPQWGEPARNGPGGGDLSADAAFCNNLWFQLQEGMSQRHRSLECRESAVAVDMRNIMAEADKLHAEKQAIMKRASEAAEAERRAKEMLEEARKQFQFAKKEAEYAQNLHQKVIRLQEELDKRTDEIGTQEAELHFKQERFLKEQAEFKKLQAAFKEQQAKRPGATVAQQDQPANGTAQVSNQDKASSGQKGRLSGLANSSLQAALAPANGPSEQVRQKPPLNALQRNFDSTNAHQPEADSDGDSLEDVPLHELLPSRRLAPSAAQQEVNGSDRSALCLAGTGTALQKSKKKGGQLERTGPKKQRVKSARKALSEDAPELVRRLRERGVLEDMMLFEVPTEQEGEDGEAGSMEALGFRELGRVLAKIYEGSAGAHPFTLTAAQIKSKQGHRYCIEALEALIEETQALKRQGQPVSWGWCRKLRSFIFNFTKQNRLVLERPEYGHATYFFEAETPRDMKSQVQRLIAVLSAPHVGRNDLLENNPLEVGDRLTEEEARLLEWHGWQRGTGLGSFLNYDSRIVHESRNSRNSDNTEGWRLKIRGHLIRGGRSEPREKPLFGHAAPVSVPDLPVVKLELEGS